MVEAGEQLQTRTRNYNLAVHTGDAIENAQRNELDWFLTLLEAVVWSRIPALARI